ncbi:hypothetical protein CAPTEDRAFT_224793 [Capitella teleta]|uniref:EngB-type G domain-containing protein n=1 Tax=Capitella teleta TaxID=283909 RepID=R7V442_CAPTE|nr:hypothetical protein CAPTEDRAFT_224793 [Capitella teleta]|eukprot:ELU13618.1 hypothetical protein CAPTEDRAFT_224793 [Capitella teleta]
MHIFTLAALLRLQRGVRLHHICQRHLHATHATSSEWCVGQPFSNPLDELKKLLQVPLIKDENLIFKPTQTEIRKAQNIFQGNRVEPLKGIVNLDQLPARDLPEIAFIGQSNVGKSSLVKSLFRSLNPKTNHRLTVSKKAGHTRTLRFYEIPRKFSLVDMPGYGENMPEHFVRSAEAYIMTRQTSRLKMTFSLLDAHRGMTENDQEFLDKLQNSNASFCLVLTKIDKVPHSHVLRAFLALNEYREKHLSTALPQIFLVSSLSGAGIPLLRSFIAYVTGNIRISGH